jgi:predicted permease
MRSKGYDRMSAFQRWRKIRRAAALEDFTMLDRMTQDVRHALRTVRRSPGFAAVAILSLALGAGANTAMFQLLDAVRLRTLPVRAPEQLVTIGVDDMTHARGAWLRDASLTNPIWEQLRRDPRPFAAIFAWADETWDLTAGSESRKVSGLWVSGELFRGLGITPVIGRLFGAEGDRRGCGQEAGVVLSHRFWQQEFGGDRSIVGRQLAIGSLRPMVIGVTPPTFFGLEVGRGFDVALPICAESARPDARGRLDSGTVWWLTVMGRLGPDASIAQAAAALQARSPAVFAATLPAGYPPASVSPYLGMTLTPHPAAQGVSHLRAQYTAPLILLLGLTGAAVLIACANLAHLAMARAAVRRREVAVRVALGAGTGRLAQQLLTESLLLSLCGVAIGLFVARVLSRTLISFLNADGNTAFLDLSLDVRTFAFLVLLTTLPAAAFTVFPLRRLRTAHPAATLTLGRQNAVEHPMARRALLTGQIALSLALLAGALMFMRSLSHLQTLAAGFDPRGVVVADVNFSALQLPSDRTIAFRHELLERVRATPGVDGAAEALFLPIAGANWNSRAWMAGSDAEHARVVMRNMIGPGYFHTMSTAIMKGRDFDDRDLTTSAAKVAIVNERFVRDFGLDAAAVGRHLWIETTPLEPSASYEIVGVVANTKYRDLREDDRAVLYVPLWQSAQRRAAGQFVVHTSGRSAAAVVPSLRNTLGGVDSNVRYAFRPFEQVVERSLERERLMAALAGPFGALAAVLTALGLYGVFSYTVVRRTQEIGIRMALGAARRDVIADVLREAVMLLVLGLALGTGLAVAASRAASTLLFGISSADPMSLAVAGALLSSVALLASSLPARRAANVDPAVALRYE